MKKNSVKHQIIVLGLAAAITAVPAAATSHISGQPVMEVTAVPIHAQATENPSFDGTDKSLLLGPNGSVIQVAAVNQPKTALFYGTAQWLEAVDNRLTLSGVNEEGNTEVKVVLTITDETLILNAVTGAPVAAKEIKAGETVYAYTSPAMTKSMPPQARAELLLVGIPADYAVPSYMEVDMVQRNEDGTVILGTDRAINVTLTDDTAVFPYLTKNIVTKDMIQPGQKALVWHGPVLLSYPGQTAATKVMVFGTQYKGFVSLNGDTFSANGAPVTFAAPALPQVDGNTYLLPLRAVAESFGYTVAWDAGTQNVSVSLGDDEVYHFVLEGETWQSGETTQSFTRPVKAVDGVSYIALDDLLTLHKLKMETRF